MNGAFEIFAGVVIVGAFAYALWSGVALPQVSIDRFRADVRNPKRWIAPVAIFVVFVAINAHAAGWAATLFAIAVFAAFVGAVVWFARRL